MRALLQRVRSGRVVVNDEVIAQIDHGLVVLVGVGQADGAEKVAGLAEKISNLRIFEDEQGKTNRSILDVKGEAIVVSQFTLYADTSKGRRPSFIHAAAPDLAGPLVARLADSLRAFGIPTQTGQFGADMLVEINNDGPFTIWLEN
jgi:D-tyrosyl-tRNA(Tyr) deacylase